MVSSANQKVFPIAPQGGDYIATGFAGYYRTYRTEKYCAFRLRNNERSELSNISNSSGFAGDYIATGFAGYYITYRTEKYFGFCTRCKMVSSANQKVFPIAPQGGDYEEGEWTYL